MNEIDKTSHVSLIDFSEPIPKGRDVINKKLEGDFLSLGTAVVWIIIYIYFELKALKTYFLNQLLTVNDEVLREHSIVS